MKFKIIALDVDGTLLDDNHRISERTKQTIHRVSKLGAKIVLCTGRGSISAQPVMEELGLEGVMITHNGASIMNTAGDVLHEYTFRVEEVASLIDYCRSRDIHYDLNTSTRMIIDRLSEDARKMYEDYLASPDMVEDALRVEDKLVKFCMFADKPIMDEVEKEWQAKRHPFRFIRSGDYFIDVMLPGVTKGRALQKLAELWGVKREEIVAMGNYFNDIDMLEYAGIGVAVGNSPDLVKEVADEVTVTNNEDAVHVTLSKHFALT